MSDILDTLLTTPQHLLPQHLLSAGAKRLAQIEQPWIKNFLIRRFMGSFPIDLEEAEFESIEQFPHFNAFFTRKLKSDRRPLPSDLRIAVSPADGTVSQFGEIEGERLVQAKGRDFTLDALLATSGARLDPFRDGQFMTIYLAPHNYHRVHTPCDGKIEDARFIPGKLYSVNQRTARKVSNLFARNERVVIELSTPNHGQVAVVLVGAMLVASIGLNCCDMEQLIYANRRGAVQQIDISSDQVDLLRGGELGWFNMGSTVIILFEKDRLQFDDRISLGQEVKMGEPIGRAIL